MNYVIALRTESSHAASSYPASHAAVPARMLTRMHEIDDQDLMLRYGRGDADAFEQLYRRHNGALYRYLARHCAHRANAEEIFQEVWMKVIAARRRYRPTAKFTTWLYRIARNACIDHFRRQGRAADQLAVAVDPEQLDSARPGPERAAAISQASQRLAAALEQLPSEQREAFLLREEGGLSLPEIAAVTGAGRETVKSRLRYALRKLRAALEEQADD